jgi:hypothetical protein
MYQKAQISVVHFRALSALETGDGLQVETLEQPRIIGTEEVTAFFDLLEDNGFFNRGNRPIVSAKARPVLTDETSDIILANAKRVTRDAWVLSNAAQVALPTHGERRADAVHQVAVE